jgi:segregation and condensation protein A
MNTDGETADDADDAMQEPTAATTTVVEPVEPVEPAEAGTGAAVTQLAAARQQASNTVALVQGEAVTALPTDLYIPPEALEVFLDTFEGPLDLLLYLIRRQNLDILNIRVAEITTQYMGYIDLMGTLQLELAGEYLLMAAMLAEIKSRMLLPRIEAEVEDEDDPRAELIRRLQEYEQIKTAAEHIEELPRLERDIVIAHAEKPEVVREVSDPEVDLKEVLLALASVLQRADRYEHHAVMAEPLSVREKMTEVLSRMQHQTEFVPFISLFTAEEGRLGVIVTFLAVMELIRESLLDIVQAEPFAPIYLKAAGE